MGVTVGERIRQLREERGESIGALARALHLSSRNSVRKWERGETLPTVDYIFYLAEWFEMPVPEFFNGVDKAF